MSPFRLRPGRAKGSRTGLRVVPVPLPAPREPGRFRLIATNVSAARRMRAGRTRCPPPVRYRRRIHRPASFPPAGRRSPPGRHGPARRPGRNRPRRPPRWARRAVARHPFSRSRRAPASGASLYDSRSTCRCAPACRASQAHFAVAWVSAFARMPAAPGATSSPVPRGAASSAGASTTRVASTISPERFGCEFGGEHDVVGLEHLAAGQGHAAVRRGADARPGSHADAAPLQVRGERLDDAVDAAVDAGDRGAGRRRGAQHEHRPRQRTGSGDRLPQARRHRVDLQFVRMPGVDAEHHRRDQTVQHAGAHASAHQVTEALAVPHRGERHQHVELGAQRARQAGHGDHVLGQRRAGDAEQAGLRQRQRVRDPRAAATPRSGSARRSRHPVRVR